MLIAILAPSFQVVQEYERAVIFRLGRLNADGAKGPGKSVSLHGCTCGIALVVAVRLQKHSDSS